jgi:poly(ADP-ribose) glycohydrolase
MEKIRCIIHYFNRIITEDHSGVVTFTRNSVRYPVVWTRSRKVLLLPAVDPNLKIEDAGADTLQVDFANKRVGGGILGRGCVQEEIRFAICPELIVSKLFTEHLHDNECLVITGAERFCKYTGYARSFQFAGNYNDTTPRDEYNRLRVQVVAMDAKSFRRSEDQFEMKVIERELNKAYCGFHEPSQEPGTPCPVITGNWGCGAFRGDPHLKFLIQLMAATEAGRELVYCTIGGGRLTRNLLEISRVLHEEQVTVGDLYNALRRCKYHHFQDDRLFNSIFRKLNMYN